jgi:hypothetical protein
VAQEISYQMIKSKTSFVVTSAKHFYNFLEHNKLGPIFAIDDAIVRYGHYLTKGDHIFTEALHENFGSKWLRYWLRDRGNSFGGFNANDLELTNGGKAIDLYSNSNNLTYVDEEGHLFQYTYDHNFHHFIMSSLPRLFHFIACGQKDQKVIVRDDTPSYQLQIIRHIVPENNILHISPTKDYQFRKIYIAPFPQWINPSQISKFFSVAFPSDSDCSLTKSNRVFLSRADTADKRPLSNAIQLEALLNQKSFQAVETSRLSFTERLKLFNEVEVIAGVFSAGFANLVFANNCKKVVFIEHPIYKIPAEYKSLCEARDIKLYIIKSSPLRRMTYRIKSRFIKRNARSLYNTHNGQGWSVDLSRLDRLLKKILREGT